MESEIFKTKREFKNKYPSGLFVCANCRQLSHDPYFCRYCGFRADGLVGTIGQGLRYTIEETGVTEEIFTPIERL